MSGEAPLPRLFGQYKLDSIGKENQIKEEEMSKLGAKGEESGEGGNGKC